MMSIEHKAIVRFWRDQLGLPVHLQGEVRDPKGMFPFMTITMGRNAFGNSTALTAFVWLKDNNSNAERAAMMDLVEQAIPEGGVRIMTEDGGLVVLDRAAEFLTIYDDPDVNSRVIGFRIGYTARYYE